MVRLADSPRTEDTKKSASPRMAGLLKFGEVERVGCYTVRKGEAKEDPVSRGPLLREESDGAAIPLSWAEEACVSSGTR